MALTHHTLAPLNDSWQLTLEKPIAFVLDEPKQRDQPKKGSKKKNKGKGGLNAKNFGAVLDIGQLKNAKRLLVGWRARHHGGLSW